MTIRRERSQSSSATDWRGDLVKLFEEFQNRNIDRRTFVTRISLLLTATALPLALLANTGKSTAIESEPVQEPWLTFAVVQNHLFPTTPGAPGAKEINASAYLKRVLSESHTDPDDKIFIRDGVGWLNDIARKQQGKAFIDLTDEQREAVLRQIEKSHAGDRWISLLILYIFEALLSNPVYGGNPDGIGWTWLQHQPGFPQPSADKTYFKL